MSDDDVLGDEELSSLMWAAFAAFRVDLNYIAEMAEDANRVLLRTCPVCGWVLRNVGNRRTHEAKCRRQG